MPQPPVIVLPGILGSVLEDAYPVDPEEVWGTVLQKEYQRIALHPDDRRFEAVEPAVLKSRNPLNLIYSDLVSELRHDLKEQQDLDVPVFPFGYDWRKDVRANAALLGAFIDQVLARVSLLPQYQNSPAVSVDLVGHSMGGMVISAYLRMKQDARTPASVHRVVTIATPFRGAVDAILKMTLGSGSLVSPQSGERERESARTMTSLYQLLPTYQGAITGDPGLPTDLFDIKTWQPSVLATQREFIRVYQAKIAAEDLLAWYLKTARDCIDSINGLDPAAVLTNGVRDWMPIVGIDEQTHLAAHVELYNNEPWFSFPDPVNDGPTSENTGDGTVPFLGACPAFLARERLVCISPDELSLWEKRWLHIPFGDMWGDLHVFLPKFSIVQRITARFLRDTFITDCEARPAPGIAQPDWPAWLQIKH